MAFKINPFTKKLDLVSDNVTATINWGDIGGLISNQVDLNAALNSKSDINHTHTSVDITDFDVEVGNHPDVVSNTTKAHDQNTDFQLRSGLVEVDILGNTQITGELGFKVFIQASEPILTGIKRMALWEDTTTGLTFLIYKNSLGIQKSVEMS